MTMTTMGEATEPICGQPRSDSEGREPQGARKEKGPRLARFVGLPVFAITAAVGVVAAFRVPVGAPEVSAGNELEELVTKGPESPYHHFFDPGALFGPIASVDLDLDNFESATGHGVLFAALPRAPADVPELAMRAAEAWQPGVDGADNGIIVFVFPEDRRIRVEVGYGLESVLPDAEVRRLVSSTLLPAARAGDLAAGVEALVPPLLERLRTVPRVEPKPHSALADLWSTARLLPQRARLASGAWRAAGLRVRLILCAFCAVLVGVFAALLAGVGHSVAMLAKKVFARAGAGQVASATFDLAGSLLRLAQIALFLFAIAIGSSFFFPGAGEFGGAGIDLRW